MTGMFLSARPVRAATLAHPVRIDQHGAVSIRAARAGRDVLHVCRGPSGTVSIRAARAGRDRCAGSWRQMPRCFYPRGPCGPRPEGWYREHMPPLFLSARPVRAATLQRTRGDVLGNVSIRAARAGRDSCTWCYQPARECFYPRGPCGPRPGRGQRLDDPLGVSIRAARAGRDVGLAPSNLPENRFYPRGPCGPRRSCASPAWGPRSFYPRGPCGPRRRTGTRPRSRRWFLSARPVRAATGPDRHGDRDCVCFYPRGPCGPRRRSGCRSSRRRSFYPRGPCGPRRRQPAEPVNAALVSIRAARAGRDDPGDRARGPAGGVSIRAARAGRDKVTKPTVAIVDEFLSARPVRAATRVAACRTSMPSAFLSARPVRAATRAGGASTEKARSFYPRGPCGPRPEGHARSRACRRFYPRGPCGPRLQQALDRLAAGVFLSARPVRAATPCSAPMKPPSASFYPRGPCGPRRSDIGDLMRISQVSIRAARAGRDPYRCPRQADNLVFLSARPVRAATTCPRRPRRRSRGFYPRGPCGPRPARPCATRSTPSFLSARPVRAATPSRPPCTSRVSFLSARPVRAATRTGRGRRSSWFVSIRAARAGRDAQHVLLRRNASCFYPRGPCGPRPVGVRQGSDRRGVSIRAARAGRDLERKEREIQEREFLSARPVRAATTPWARAWQLTSSFYPRGPCGPRRPERPGPRRPGRVSIRAARAGRDPAAGFNALAEHPFLSARPVRAATTARSSRPSRPRVSIRAARAGRDLRRSRRSRSCRCFYPRGPCGPRP